MLLCFVTQGGDLIKWEKAKVGYYVGVDIAEGSVSFLTHRDIYSAFTSKPGVVYYLYIQLTHF